MLRQTANGAGGSSGAVSRVKLWDMTGNGPAGYGRARNEVVEMTVLNGLHEAVYDIRPLNELVTWLMLCLKRCLVVTLRPPPPANWTSIGSMRARSTELQ